MGKIFQLLIIATLLCAGCGPAPPDDPNSVRYVQGSDLGSLLPEKAYDLVDRGNGWYTYCIQIDSTRYKMLVHITKADGGTRNMATTVLLKNDAID